MNGSKFVKVPLAAHINLSSAHSPKTEEEFREMRNIPYSNAIGSVMFSMITTRPDLAYAISFLSKFMSYPGKPHWAGLKWLLKYIVDTLNLGLVYEKRSEKLTLKGYVDSDFAGDKDNRKSTTAYFFTLGDNCITWKSQLQPLVTL
ncbi:F-box LRR-repeat 20-like [Olea europaea subsp. europaea]|uniref:F-box LRR-repeat 20-like n=1 Tax=Olea europaea subsp. europaea TaxID=158383 RepID=A0A8S0TTR3_OLEEU|nr:F-box LRR-repeat 20-like [Olea europaea subsp. europaea]